MSITVKGAVVNGPGFAWGKAKDCALRMGWRPRRVSPLPDFLGIGAQKAGTTWLHENLRSHPELYLPEAKELHYFDWNFHRSLRFYSGHFRAGAGRVTGEITPGYSILPPTRIALIRDLMPDLRLLFLVRNPIDRAWSQALMNLVSRDNRRCEDVSEDEFRRHFRSARSARRGDYLRTIDDWLAHFPQEQLFVGFYEDFSARPRELLADVFRHLRVSTDVDWTAFPYHRVVFKGVRAPLPTHLRAELVEMYRDDLRRLGERFGQRVGAWQLAEE